MAGFIEKSKDFMSPELLACLGASPVGIVASLFADEKGQSRRPTIGYRTSAATRTAWSLRHSMRCTARARDPAAAEFATQVNELTEILSGAMCHYVRCVKPNNSKSATEYDKPMVLEQLNYSGVLKRVERGDHPL